MPDEKTAALIFRFRERAAMRQFLGNETHYLAGFNAANELRKEIAPEPLPAEIRREVTGDGVVRELWE
jgi:hypothetical protein